MPQKNARSGGPGMFAHGFTLAGEEGTICRHQISHQFARHRPRRPVAMAAPFNDFSMHWFQLLVVHRRQFGGFDERALRMRVTLFGKRPAFLLARRFAQGAGQAAITQGVFDRRKTLRRRAFTRSSSAG